MARGWGGQTRNTPSQLDLGKTPPQSPHRAGERQGDRNDRNASVFPIPAERRKTPFARRRFPAPFPSTIGGRPSAAQGISRVIPVFPRPFYDWIKDFLDQLFFFVCFVAGEKTAVHLCAGSPFVALWRAV